MKSTIKHQDNSLKISVTLDRSYKDMFPNSDFANVWGNMGLYEISLVIRDRNIDLVVFTFSPRRVSFINDEGEYQYYYDMLEPEERRYFKGQGLKYLCLLLKYGLTHGLFDINSNIYTHATELSYADPQNEDITPTDATERFRNLVKFYQSIGFQTTIPINWEMEINRLRGNRFLKPLVSAEMKSTVGEVITHCDK